MNRLESKRDGGTGPEVSRERRKALLTCPACGYVSHATGSWRVHREERHDRAVDRVHCPDCDVHITTRPAPAEN